MGGWCVESITNDECTKDGVQETSRKIGEQRGKGERKVWRCGDEGRMMVPSSDRHLDRVWHESDQRSKVKDKRRNPSAIVNFAHGSGKNPLDDDVSKNNAHACGNTTDEKRSRNAWPSIIRFDLGG